MFFISNVSGAESSVADEALIVEGSTAGIAFALRSISVKGYSSGDGTAWAGGGTRLRTTGLTVDGVVWPEAAALEDTRTIERSKQLSFIPSP
jgi:hypothetical protein